MTAVTTLEVRQVSPNHGLKEVFVVGSMASGETWDATGYFSTIYGVTDEGHQYFVPPRQTDVFDLMADAIGAAVSAGVLYAGIIRTRHGL